MLKLVVLVSLVGLAFGLPAELLGDSLITTNYHETIGIKEAALIKGFEDAINFDGSRIVGGSPANVGQYPHLGGLVISLTSGQTSVCGSSLISNTRLVTAAHCWFDGSSQARQFEVVLGSVRLFTGGTRIVSNNVVMHPGWNPRLIRDDVAVIRINHVGYTNSIRNINLASGNNNYAGAWAQAAGFGVQRDGTGISTAQTKHHVTVQVITNAQCNQWFPGSIVDSTLCIDGAQGRSTCGGDSGGPLAINGNTLIGITSFGYRWGCERGWPAAFARVTSFQAWLRAQ